MEPFKIWKLHAIEDQSVVVSSNKLNVCDIYIAAFIFGDITHLPHTQLHQLPFDILNFDIGRIPKETHYHLYINE